MAQFGGFVNFDKRFKGIDKHLQKNVVKFPHVSAEELKSMACADGDVMLLSTGLFCARTTRERAGENLCSGEVLTIPTGGAANLKYHKGLFVDSGNILCVAKNKDVCLKYVYYGLLAKKDEVEHSFRGASIKHPQMAEIWGIDIPERAIDKQEAIVTELDTIHSILDKKRKQLTELDNLVQSIFYDMFGDPVTNKKGWKVRSLESCIRVIGGYAFSSKDFLKEGSIPILKIGNINSGSFRATNLVFWHKDENLSRYEIRPGDLVMSLTGTVGKSDYGNVCILDNTYDLYYLNQRNAKLEIYKDIEKYYLCSILKFDGIKEKLTGINRGVRQANISNKDIESLCIPLPPLALQQEFAAKVEAIEAQKELIRKSIREVEALLAQTMDKYFG